MKATKPSFETKKDKRRRGDRVHVPAKRHLEHPPKKVDLRRKVPARLWPIWNQTCLYSCTAHAAAGVALFAMIRAKRRPLFQPSRRFLYHCEQVLGWKDHQTSSQDIGTVRYAMAILRERGMCADVPARGVPKDAVWPYAKVPDDLFTKPKESCFEFAKTQRMPEASFYLKAELAHLRGCLAEGHPFTICIGLYESYNLKTTTKTGDIPMPPVSPMPAPGPATPGSWAPTIVDVPTGDRHAMVVVGYDDARQVFIVRNSMGAKWGKRGYGTIPYAYVLGGPDLCDSFWTLRLR